MYDYELSENEEVKIISDKSLLKKGDIVSNVTTIITNQRFLILEIPTDLEGFRFGRTINYPITKEVIFETRIQSIIATKKDRDFTKYILDNSNYFYLNDDEIYKYMSKINKY